MQHLQPADLGEHLRALAEDAPVVGEHAQAVAQRVRDVHVLAVAPERRVLALGHAMVRDQEIADAVDLEVRVRVALVDVVLLEAAVRKNAVRRAIADWIRWMLVDSSGSRKPLDRPMA